MMHLLHLSIVALACAIHPAWAADELVTSARATSGEVVPYVLTTKPGTPAYAVILMPGGKGILNPRMEGGKLALAAGAQDGKEKRPLKVATDRASGLVHAEDAVPTRGEWGEWRRYFRGDTHGTKDMVVLAVSLKPGQAPHPPHRHPEEEFLIVADGTGIIECDGKVTQVGPGAMMYCAGDTLHGITNTGTTPMTFYRSKWLAKGFSA